MEDYAQLAQKFQQLRSSIVKSISHQFAGLDAETIDLIYTDSWFELTSKSINRVRKLRPFLYTLVSRRVINHVRNAAASEDIFDRYVQEYGQNTDEPQDITSLLENLPDHREHDAEAMEVITERVQASLAGIPKTLRLIGEWYYVDGITIRDIGERLGFGKSQVFRMLVQFRLLFKEAYMFLLKLEEGPKTT